jgi:hypothetical protein
MGQGNPVVTMTNSQRKELFVTQDNDTYDACVWSKKLRPACRAWPLPAADGSFLKILRSLEPWVKMDK